MAKGQKRSNRETKKPKKAVADKAKASAVAMLDASRSNVKLPSKKG